MSLDLLQKIKAILMSADVPVVEPVVEPVAHISVTDASGNTYEVEALEIGNVMTMDKVPLPEGDYTIDGKVITTDKDGIITAIADVAVEGKEPIEQASESISKEQVQSMIDEAIANFKKGSDTKMSAIDKAITTNHSVTSSALEATALAIEELSKEPNAKPLHVENTKVNHMQLAKNEARKSLSETIQNLNKNK